MKVISTTVTIMDIDANGMVKVVDSRTTVEKLPDVDNHEAGSVEICSDTFTVTDSQKAYNYVSFGKNSRIQLGKYEEIQVEAEWCERIKRRTHKSQTNRLDKMLPILSGVNAGETIKLQYNPQSKILTFIKL